MSFRQEWSEMDHEERQELLTWILCPMEGTKIHVGNSAVSWTAENGSKKLWPLYKLFEIIEWLSTPSKDGVEGG